MKNSLLLPVLIGATAAGAIAWFLLSEDTAELRESLLEKLTDSFDSIKEKAIDKMSA
ncbi:MAG TPA: hypothetical protein VK668_24550 [Mucilaginibacter sp.]|nr:hypothetical protein [Mucilaginibacter sp.]